MEAVELSLGGRAHNVRDANYSNMGVRKTMTRVFPLPRLRSPHLSTPFLDQSARDGRFPQFRGS